MAAFALHGSATGGIYIRLPEIQASLGIPEGIYGLVLLAMPIGVLSGSVTVPKPIERFGPRLVTAFGLVVATVVQMAAALAPGPASLAATLLVFGIVFAAANVAVNVEANRFEVDQGKQIMSRCHGWWALGFLATSFVAAGIVRLEISPLLQFAGHALVMTAMTFALILPMPESTPRDKGKPSRRFAVPGRGVLLIGAWALAGVLMEGTTRGWIVIYVRDSYDATEAIAALALPALVLTQTAARFGADHIITRYGIINVARMSAVILCVGTIAITLSPNVPLALAGCLLIGAGIAINMPQAFAASGRLTDRPPAESVAAFASLSTLIGFMGPPLFGGLAEIIGLRAAFALIIPMTLISFLMAGVLKSETEKTG